MKTIPDKLIPDALSAAHSQKLSLEIGREISKQGPITFARFMELALYFPGLGYYSAGARKFGAEGDFVTAPEISPLYSRCIAKQCQQVLAELGGGDILEFGAGSGIMAVDLLTELVQQSCLPEHYFILEVSADLKQRQQQLLQQRLPEYYSHIQWLDAFPAEFRGVMIANEVFDAMPVHKFKWQDGVVKEFYVDLQNNKFCWHIDKPSTPELVSKVNGLNINFTEGYESEINLTLESWLKSIGQVLTKGMLLIVDYGFVCNEYYHSDRDQGTLMCHFRHQAHDNPLLWPGIQDITAHVDFTAVAEAALLANLNVMGYVSQLHFLLNCGITEMAASKDQQEQFVINQQIKRLILPSEMGELFKVMALTKNLDIALLGFKLFDTREKL